tara:strand:+ start:283 stop:666 length:384 start_codon:yes stop_codon:yes gene_type:complete
MINKNSKPIDSPTINAGLSTNNEKLPPQMTPLPDIFFLKKIKLIISEKVRLKIRKYETGFVSLLIVLLKLNKSTVMKIDAIIGSPGTNQARFNNIDFSQASFYMQLYLVELVLGVQEKQDQKKLKKK